MTRLLTPNEDSITLNGRILFDSKKNINVLPRNRKIGYVFQNYALFSHLTVEKNIAFGIKDNYKGIVLLVTHYVEEAYSLSDKILVFDRGETVQIGKKEGVIQKPVNLHTCS